MSTPDVPLLDVALWRTRTAAPRRAWLAARVDDALGESTQVAGYRLSLPSCGAVREEAGGSHAAYQVRALL